SLTDKLRNAGFAIIDSFNKARSWTFAYRKNSNILFTPVFSMSSGIYERNNFTFQIYGYESDGQISSPKFGPSKKWESFHWKGKSLENPSTDSVSIKIFGIKTSGSSDLLATIKARDTSLSFINAATYPYVQLKMFNNDSVNATPSQLLYWRINAQAVPEGAVAPNISFNMKDTIETGESISFALAFKNISESAFDSLKIKFTITDKNNIVHPIVMPRGKPLIAGDTLMINYTIDTRNYTGTNTLFVEVNPDNDQPEQYHNNNFIFKNFYVKGDNYNPLLDVTFDGVHILNRDIVSARPHIIIKLKDESKYLELNDTSLIKVQLQYPDGTLRSYKFDNDTLRFTPANLASGENTATIDFTPVLSGDDDEYQLIVSGKDVSGNTAGDLEYRVSFRIISKPMISNLLNYPNPFTTSTAFVFTVTGSQPPQNIRIQILTITGKIVREITSNELGALHVGRNITEFKWDGTDMYGQRLANGVYLYRVLTNLNGKSLEKYKAADDDTDKYFTKGYGKMYLMK
ncbi:MAG: FlgD immunoglobulin-like domain containing protein, partial [Ginsengibacter sp.]